MREKTLMEFVDATPIQIKSIYDQLQDDESRQIFDSRLRYFFDGDNDRFIEKVVHPFMVKWGLDNIIEKLKKEKAAGKEIICYGAGAFGKSLSKVLCHYGLGPDLFCDRCAKNQNDATSIISPDELFLRHRESAVIISTFRFMDEIKAILLSNGIEENNIYDQFAQEERKGDEDYWRHSFFYPAPEEVYIDGGVFDCGSIKHFIRFDGGNYRKIYGFEPDPISYERCLQVLERDNLLRVEIINKGLWSSENFLRFNAQNSGNSYVDENGSDIIGVSKLDEIIGSERVTFIKLDIEGAELNALKGAIKTISRDKPRLAICVYHKPEDILQIPLFILGIVPEYNFWLRHETPTMGQTVLYAVADL